ncbi:MAG: hypothetical protein FWE31_00425 [Firmicutes bacterium]|nr:hypothetical protein [Bacillota bacterium]
MKGLRLSAAILAIIVCIIGAASTIIEIIEMDLFYDFDIISIEVILSMIIASALLIAFFVVAIILCAKRSRGLIITILVLTCVILAFLVAGIAMVATGDYSVPVVYWILNGVNLALLITIVILSAIYLTRRVTKYTIYKKNKKLLDRMLTEGSIREDFYRQVLAEEAGKL